MARASAPLTPTLAAPPVKGTGLAVELDEAVGAVVGAAVMVDLADETALEADETADETADEMALEADETADEAAGGSAMGTPTPAQVSATTFWTPARENMVSDVFLRDEHMGMGGQNSLAASEGEQALSTQGVIWPVRAVLEQWHLKSVMDEHPSPLRAVRKHACEQAGMLGSPWAETRATTRERAATEYFILTV